MPQLQPLSPSLFPITCFHRPNARRTVRLSAHQMLRFLYRLPRRTLWGVVRGYQLVIAPHLPSTCRYTPSCSNYALQALGQYGAVKGTILTVHRLLRCHPWGGHGYDPPRWFGETSDNVNLCQDPVASSAQTDSNS